MNILNLYCGLGGNRKKWPEYVSVTAVENNPEIANIYKLNFPNDNVIVGDAHEYLRNNIDNFDFIWSSPPCQSHSRMVKATRHKVRKYPDFRLYEEIVFLKHFSGCKWVVENVAPYYGYLIEPTVIIGRHPFWSNFDIKKIKAKSPKGFITIENSSGAEMLKKLYGINYDGNIYIDGNHSPVQALRNCVDPDVGLYVFEQSLKQNH